MTCVRIAFCSIFFCSAWALTAAQIPPFFVDSVVALGRSEVRAPGQPPEWVTEASGFLFGHPEDNETDRVKHKYSVYLITNRHVLANHITITVRLNAEKATDPVQQFPLNLKDASGADLWISHPNPSIDISVIGINGQYLRDHGLKSSFFAGDEHAANQAKLREIGIAVGDGVFVLGFPMGLSGTTQRNYVIARQGCIARISDLLDSAAMSFFLVKTRYIRINFKSKISFKADFFPFIDYKVMRSRQVI